MPMVLILSVGFTSRPAIWVPFSPKIYIRLELQLDRYFVAIDRADICRHNKPYLG
jgi:hypothetical protein